MPYFIFRKNKVSGPFSKNEVISEVNSGRIYEDDDISGSKTGPWIKVATWRNWKETSEETALNMPLYVKRGSKEIIGPYNLNYVLNGPFHDWEFISYSPEGPWQTIYGLKSADKADQQKFVDMEAFGTSTITSSAAPKTSRAASEPDPETSEGGCFEACQTSEKGRKKRSSAAPKTSRAASEPDPEMSDVTLWTIVVGSIIALLALVLMVVGVATDGSVIPSLPSIASMAAIGRWCLAVLIVTFVLGGISVFLFHEYSFRDENGRISQAKIIFFRDHVLGPKAIPLMFFYLVMFTVTLGALNKIGLISLPSKSTSYDDDQLDAWVMAMQFVKDRLRSPSTSSFGKIFSGEIQSSKDTVKQISENRYAVKGWVDAQNGFGATVRADFSCEVEKQSNGKWKCYNLQIE